MLHLRVVGDSTAGTETVARHFPFRIGRSEESDLRFEQPGVWEEHAAFYLEDGALKLAGSGQASVRLNGRLLAAAAPVRSGDLMEVGAVRIRIGLATAVQREGTITRLLLLAMIAGVSALQIGLFFWLADQ